MKLALRHQILLITLLPILVIDIFFTVRNYNHEIDRAGELLTNKAEIISRHLASAFELYLFSGDSEQIEKLLLQSTSDGDVAFAKVFDRDGRLIAQAGSASFNSSEIADYYYQRTPVRLQQTVFDDVFYTDTLEDQQIELGWVHLYLSQKSRQQAISDALLDSLFLFAFILIIAAIISELVSRRISHPISLLLDHVKRVESGELTDRIENIDSNELGEVQRGFNQMTESLQNNQAQLNQRITQATEQLNEAIIDLEQKNDELSVARDEAQHANRIKSAFLANMSHEIRTPINGIQGFVGLLADSSLDKTQKRYIDIIERSVGDLSNIINDILDLSKIESGKLRIVSEVFDLYEVVEQTRDILYINTVGKQIDCFLIIYGDVPRYVVGDKHRLNQILLNLIGNAIKFTDRGQIIIKVSIIDESTEEADILFSIEDSGIGISTDDQQHLFEAFAQVETAENRRFQGTGLGLVISRNLASMMGGKISMSSELHQGSTFEVLLPLKKVDTEIMPEKDEAELSALAISGSKIGLAEVTSLLARNDVIPEPSLINSQDVDQQVVDVIGRCLTLVDLVVIDNRHLAANLTDIISPDLAQQAKFIVIDDKNLSLKATTSGHIHQVPVPMTSREFNQLVYSASLEDHAAPGRQADANHKKRVLLVDDNLVNLTLGEELLKHWGHEVCSRSLGSQALELFSREEFDFVLLDIQMPEIDGLSLLKKMKALKPDTQSRFIATTATVVDEKDNRFIELGFDFYLAKPIDRRRFRQIIEGHAVDDTPARQWKVQPETDLSFDYQASLELSAGKPDLLKRILQILLNDLPVFRQQLQDFQDSHDVSKLGAVIHKIHGVTCYCSLPKLKRLVVGTETRLSEFGEERLLTLTQQLSEELQNVETEVISCLQEMVA